MTGVEAGGAASPPKPPRLPPSWFIRAAWRVHRAIYRLTNGRRGLWPPTDRTWGALRLHSTGRRTGRERTAILGYKLDGRNMIALAMNGWMRGEPAWWLNLQAHPEARVDTASASLTVRARSAIGAERERLWALFPGADRFAPLRSGETAVVVLEPVTGSEGAPEA